MVNFFYKFIDNIKLHSDYIFIIIYLYPFYIITYQYMVLYNENRDCLASELGR